MFLTILRVALFELAVAKHLKLNNVQLVSLGRHGSPDKNIAQLRKALISERMGVLKRKQRVEVN